MRSASTSRSTSVLKLVLKSSVSPIPSTGFQKKNFSLT